MAEADAVEVAERAAELFEVGTTTGTQLLLSQTVTVMLEHGMTQVVVVTLHVSSSQTVTATVSV